jgi:hypothetical protein
MDAPKSITANFQPSRYPLNVIVYGSGSVTKSPDQPDYAHESIVTVTAVPAPGWHFTGWSEGDGDQIVGHGHGGCPDCVSGLTNPVNVTMRGSRTLYASFEINPSALMIQVDGRGSVTQRPTAIDSTVTLVALPDSGWRFVGWKGDVQVASNPLAIKLGEPRHVTATFRREIGVAPEGLATGDFSLGKISPNPTARAARIEFYVARSASIKLSIMDVGGREIAVLASGVLDAGQHAVSWDGRTRRGDAPAGVYFVRYRADGRDLVRRILLTR